jgi:predicted ArsR family transcriptional regulator
MKTTVSVSEFRDAFRSVRSNNFSYEALGHLFEYLEQYEQDTGEELELDVIAICCDFAEDTWQNIADQYGVDLEGCDEDEDKQQAVADYLTDQGAYVATVGECLVYRSF